MNDHLHRDLATLSGAPVRRADQVCDAFEAAWKAGPRPRIEDHLAVVAEPERQAVLHELILLEVDYRRLAGEHPTAGEYLARFAFLDPVWVKDALATPDNGPTSSDPNAPAEANVPSQLGKFQLLERLGHGGCGTVWRARDSELQRIVALKVPHPSLLASPSSRQRFRREARAAARLSHPNVVTLFEVEQAGDTPFLVMEYLEGMDLARLVKQSGTLSIPQACRAIRQAALGLHHAHENGLVHRDIKPANLFLTRGGAVKVLDLGLARLLRRADETTAVNLTEPGCVMGTADYIAPEQVRDARTADARSDVYSLGCSLYFLLTGRVPFPGGTVMDKMLRHSSEEPPPVEQLQPEVSPALAAVVRRMMARLPEQRYQTAAEAASALAAVRAPVPRSARRPVGILVTGLAVLGLLLLLFWSRADRAEQPRSSEPGSSSVAVPPRSFANSIGMELVRIEPGDFWMGTDRSDRWWLGPQEMPRHRVTLTRPFYLGVCEVTQREYEAVMSTNPAHFTANRGGGPEHPVETVSHATALLFCQRLSALAAERQMRRTYRLPTEAEWEYACRAGSTTPWPFGDNQASLHDFAWHAGNSGGRTHPVRQLRPNAWGLYDMLGNVWEWCADVADRDYYTRSPLIDPFCDRGGDGRILRGGGWAKRMGDWKWCRPAARGLRLPDERSSDLGLRVACDVPEG